MNKYKFCKRGTDKAYGFEGCKKEIPVMRFGKRNFKYGLGISCGCYAKWLSTTEDLEETINKSIIIGKKRVDKEIKKENNKKKENVRQKSFYEKKLQTIINSIVRLIDNDKGCISCSHGWDGNWTRQRHAGHRLSVGSHPELRFNFLNNFVQCSICNNYKSGNERAYDKGLIKHYGELFYNEVSGLKGEYKSLKLTKTELQEIIENANKIKQDILSGKDYSRKEINKLLGIY